MAKKSKGKGKATQGRAGKKQKSSRAGGSLSHQSPGWQRQIMMDEDDDEDFDTFRSFKGFAQAQGHTREDGPRVPSFKLRNQAITFVSAGTNTPTVTPPQDLDEVHADNGQEEENDDDDDDEDDEEVEIVDLQTNIVPEPEIGVSEKAMANMNLDGAADERDRDITSEAMDIQPDPPADEALFIVDTVGDPTLAGPPQVTSHNRPQRAPSPARSDSSEEVVVFHGRKKPTVVNDPIGAPPKLAAPAVQPVASTLSSQPALEKSASQAESVNPITKPEARTTPQQHPPQASESRKETVATPPTLTVARATPEIRSGKPSQQPSDPSQRFAASGWATKQPKREEEVNPDATWAPAPAGRWWNKTENQEPAQSAEDTIAELQSQWKRVLRDKKQVKEIARAADPQNDPPSSMRNSSSRAPDVISLGGAQKPTRRSKRGRKKDNRQLRSAVGSTDDDDGIDGEADAAEEAAYIDYMENLKKSLDEDEDGDEMAHAFASTRSAHNAALAGASMVVDGEAIPDDEVLDRDAHADVDGNEASEVEDEDAWVSDDSDDDDDDDDDGDEDLGSSDLEDELEYTEQQQWEDEEDLRRRRVEAMSDEKIAQLFAKQNELGIDGDEIVLEDGSYMSTDDNMLEGIGDLSAARAGLASFQSFGNPRRRSGGQGQVTSTSKRTPRRGNGPTFVDASALADTVEQYGESGFDIMDFERPSLRPTKKGRKGRLPPELETLSDDELRENLAVQWTNDRSRKAAKKAEREALRHEGLLGVNSDSENGTAGKADLKAKYPFGMTMPQVHEEIRLFLENDRVQTRSFPPMNKTDRQGLHQIANAVGLKSKSIGSGKSRFPVLTKTKGTVYDPTRLQHAIKTSERGWFGSSGKKGKKGGKGAAKGGAGAGKGGGFTKDAVTLRNGEVVGAGAAEIGKENFGHRMMEKMGWSKGQALGKEGEGRLVPVEQVMRSGRAGLG